MSIDRTDILYHCRRHRGLLGIRSKVPVRDEYMLSLLYTPGVAEPCRRIHADVSTAYIYTTKGNSVALLSDGTAEAVQGLGTLGILPLLESWAVMARELAAVDVYPFSVDASNGASLLETASTISPAVAAIALGGVAYPGLFELRDQIQDSTGLPVLCLGSEILATLLGVGLLNAARALGIAPDQLGVHVDGLDAATAALLAMADEMPFRLSLSSGEDSCLASPGESPKDCQVLIRSSRSGGPAAESFRFVFDLSPEGGGSDRAGIFSLWQADDIAFHPALVFPGIFRGIADCRLKEFPLHFYGKVAQTIAAKQPATSLREGSLFPSPLDLTMAPEVARTITELALAEGLASDLDPSEIQERDLERLYQANPVGIDALVSRQGETNPDRLAQESLELHERFGGAIEIQSKVRVRDDYMLRLLSPPCILIPAREIVSNPARVYEYTSKSNLVAVITDGSSVLGLGNIGPEAGLPVMEGKCLLLKTLAGVEAFPICLGSQDPEIIIRVVRSLLPILGAVNLEDISAPRCFEIERRLREIAEVPIFHDDQHGTAIVVLAGVLNSCRLLGLPLGEASVAINGAGASALSVTRLLQHAGVRNIVLCDRQGALYKGREGLNPYKAEIAEVTNSEGLKGPLEEVLRGHQIFIGLSAPGVVSQKMIGSMAPDPIVFALANPTPEIMPKLALEAGAAVVATGRSDFRNQINNSLAFPGVFRGVLDVRGRTINEEMKSAAAHAIADLIMPSELRSDYIIPHALDARVPPMVAAAVARAALQTNQARVLVGPRVVRDNTKEFLYGGCLDPVVGEPI